MLTQPSPTTIQIPSDFILQLESSICKDSLHQFVKMAWHIVEPFTEFVDGWHIHAICDHLEALYYGGIPSKRLIINIPPRHMKSLLVNVFFPAWVWTREPHKKFICMSHGTDVTTRDSLACRNLINSNWYQERFPHVSLSKDQQEKVNFQNTAKGFRKSFGMTGGVTGEGGDFVLVDDPIKIQDAESEAVRIEANFVMDNVIPSRLNNPKTGVIVVIMQRLHENDPTGHMLEKGGWDSLVLPAEYEGITRFTSPIGFKDPRTEPGELLWMERFGKAEIEMLKKSLSAYMVASQLQQRPAPLEGNIFLRKWFANRYSDQQIIAIYISIDTALSDSDEAARSAILVSGFTAQNRLIPLYVWKDKVKFPDLVDKILEIAKKYCDLLYSLIIEAKVSGVSAMQTIAKLSPEWLRDQDGNLKIHPFTPPANLKKDERARLASKWCENGMVILPPLTDENRDWLPDFEKELFDAPNGRYMDQVDCLVQLIFVLEEVLSDGYLYGQGR